MAVKCPKCQLDNPQTSKSCADCGTQLAATEVEDAKRRLEALKNWLRPVGPHGPEYKKTI